MAYFYIKLAHIICSTILMWTLGISAVTIAAQTARFVVIADLAVTTPALFIQFGTGATLLYLAAFNPAEAWILSGIMLYLIALACWVPTVGLQIKMRNLALALAKLDEPPGPDYHALERRWATLAVATFTALVGVLYFMLEKPTGL